MCKFCVTNGKFSESGDDIISKEDFNIRIVRQSHCEYSIVSSVYEELKNIRGQYSNSPSKGYSQRIYFCPMCGRELNK